MNDISVTLYPANWLYNAGVVGFLRVLEAAGESLSDLLSDDGTINGNDLIDRINVVIHNKKTTSLPKPINELPAWHWNYAKLSFEQNYGSVRNFVTENLERAQRVANRTQLRDQLKCKDFTYANCSMDFGKINQRITNVFAQTFGRSATLTIDRAINEIVKEIEDEEKKNGYIFRKSIGYLFSKGGFYVNLFNPNWFNDLKKFIEFFTKENIFRNSTSELRCAFCSGGNFEVEPIDAKQMSFLFPVFSQFPNAYWQNNKSAVTQICSFCKFIIIHHHFTLTHLADGSEIFINAPSFKVMYSLNKLARETFGASTSQQSREKREILAMSIIDYTTKVNTTLGIWTGMNIEVVNKYKKRVGNSGNPSRDFKDEIEFFSLPYECIQMLSDREIAGILSDIGEFRVVNLVLDRKFSRIVEDAYRVLRIGLKSFNKRNENERRFLNDYFRIDKNKRNPEQTAQKMLKLYALVEQKTKRS